MQTSQATESFTLSAIDLSSAGKDGRPTTLGEIMKQVMANHKIRIEASTNQKTRQTTFHLKADSKKELEKGKRNLLAALSPVVRIVYLFPTPSHVTTGLSRRRCTCLHYCRYHWPQRQGRDEFTGDGTLTMCCI